MTNTGPESAYICATCGTQFPPSLNPPAACPICDDERQYVGAAGQTWTTLSQLRRTHRNMFQRLEPDLYGIGSAPQFAIGQRALLIRTPAGNVLWDCISLLDDATIDIIAALGGLQAIAISHPHFYTTMVEWARVFNVPVHLHAANRRWVMRPDPAIQFWEGETKDLLPGLRLTRVGGHFAGSSVLTWEAGAAGRGALLSGDMPQVVSDRRYVSFMRSYPNLLPLPPAEVARITGVVAGLRFDRIYAGFWDAHVREDAQAAVQRSAARYVAWSRGQDGRDASV